MIKFPVFSAVVHPWQCDTMGHMNTRFYASIFDDATLQFLLTIAPDAQSYLGWADVTWSIAYIREVTVGNCVQVTSKIAELGTKSLTVSHSMHGLDGSTVFATGLLKIARFDKNARRAIAIEEPIRQRLSESIAG